VQNAYRLTQTEAPDSEPVDLDDVKTHTRIDISQDDGYVSQLIAAARRYIEREQSRQLITAEWEMKFDYFPCWEIELPIAPVQEVTIEYVDTVGVTQTLNSANYVLQTSSNGSTYVLPSFGHIWPITQFRPDAVTITITAGYGDDPEDVPETTRHLIYLLVSHWYENREPVVTGTVSSLPLAAEALLEAERWHGYP